MSHRTPNQTLETLTLGNLVIRDSRKNQHQRFDDDSQIIALNFFGIKAQEVPEIKAKRIAKAKRNFKHEAELLMVDYFNGFENNFGFKKPIGGKAI